jgi:hypothetical protein
MKREGCRILVLHDHVLHFKSFSTPNSRLLSYPLYIDALQQAIICGTAVDIQSNYSWDNKRSYSQ